MPRRRQKRNARAAASPHLHERYRRDRAVASTPDYRNEHGDSGIDVMVGEKIVSGPFTTDAEAWRWIDRQTVARRSEQWSQCKTIVLTPVDSAFWRAWRDNPAA
jgi:hypothetical protein